MVEWRRLDRSPYRNYEVSDDGRIRRDGRELAGSVDRYGYRTVMLSYAGLSRRFKLHRLVCETFHGICPEGKECGHLNGSPTDNRACNLAWITRAENIEHCFIHGSRERGKTTYKKRGEYRRSIVRNASGYWVKLTDEQVAEMRRMHSKGHSAYSLAKLYGVCKRTTQRIVNGTERGTADSPA